MCIRDRLEGLHSARRGDFRIVYRIDDDHVTILAIDHRAEIYRPDEPRGRRQMRMAARAEAFEHPLCQHGVAQPECKNSTNMANRIRSTTPTSMASAAPTLMAVPPEKSRGRGYRDGRGA